MRYLAKAVLMAVFGLPLQMPSVNAAEIVAAPLWRYASPSEACEIAANSAETGRIFVTTGGGIDVVEAATSRQVGTLERPVGFHATSVACSGPLAAVAWAADDKKQRGRIIFYDARKLVELVSYPAGYLPDMITFTPDGKHLLAANEGEPNDDYSFDPEGSVSILSAQGDWLHAKVVEADFSKFNSQKADFISRGIRVFGPNPASADRTASVAQDLEPEYIAVSPDSKFAWITLQENNAVAELDIEKSEIAAVFPLGYCSFSEPTTGLDVSDVDGGIQIRPWPIVGMYQADGIAAFTEQGEIYLVTANEGDPRNYATYTEALRIGDLATEGIAVDPENPARELITDPDLARLEITRAAGDFDRDGDLDQLVCFGTRSFSLWRRSGGELVQVFDSGSDFEQIVAREAPQLFNVDSKPASPPDIRSPARGPEPESIALFTLDQRRIAAIGLERTGGVMFYDISRPLAPEFLGFLQPSQEGADRDRAPEGLLFISAQDNSLHQPLLVLCNEASGTMTAYALSLVSPD